MSDEVRLEVTYKELDRMAGDFFLKLSFTPDDNPTWVKIVKKDLLRVLRNDFIYGSKVDIGKTGDKVYVYGLI